MGIFRTIFDDSSNPPRHKHLSCGDTPLYPNQELSLSQLFQDWSSVFSYKIFSRHIAYGYTDVYPNWKMPEMAAATLQLPPSKSEAGFRLMQEKDRSLTGAQMGKTIEENVAAALERVNAGIELSYVNAMLNKRKTGFYTGDRSLVIDPFDVRYNLRSIPMLNMV